MDLPGSVDGKKTKRDFEGYDDDDDDDDDVYDDDDEDKQEIRNCLNYLTNILPLSGTIEMLSKRRQANLGPYSRHSTRNTCAR
jgi:hypothetical protein